MPELFDWAGLFLLGFSVFAVQIIEARRKAKKE